MSLKKKPKNDPLTRNKGLNRSLRVKDKRKRVHDQMHVGLQDRLEREMKIRDGAIRLMGACTHETQLLEAAKTLHTSNARTFTYMAELQKLKAAEVMEAIMDEPGFSDNLRTCKGRIAVSDIRVPLVWREVFSHSKSRDHNRHAVFCLLSVGSEVQDTELICVDKSTTDIAFSDVIVFEQAAYDFKLTLDIFAYPMSSSEVSAPTPQKLLSRLNRSIGKGEGKRVRERLREDSCHGMKMGPQYEKIATLTLTLGDVNESVRSHDLDRTPQTRINLPLYESISCRLVAQPNCITSVSVSGFLHTLNMIGSVPNWCFLWCEVKGGLIKGWINPEDTKKPPQLSIDLAPKDLKINEIEKIRQKRPNSFQIRDTTERHLFAASDKNDMVRWIRGLRQHKSDLGAWSIACDAGVAHRAPMFIASPSPRNLPSEFIFDRGVRKTLIYDQLNVDSPVKAMAEAIKCTDLLNGQNFDPNQVSSSVQSILLESQATAPWVEFFTGGLGTRPAKVTRKTDIKSKSEVAEGQHDYNLRATSNRQQVPSSATRLSKIKQKTTLVLCSEASGSDDAFLSESDDSNGKGVAQNASKKKRRAPVPPKNQLKNGFSNTPPPKPPLPKNPPRNLRSKSRASLSSGSSLDDILEERKCRGKLESSLRRIGVNEAGTNSDLSGSHRASQSSGYKSETESTSSSINDRVWAKQKNCVMPSAVVPLSGGVASPKGHYFERSRSFDEGVHHISALKSGVSSSPNGLEVIYAEPEECRPRTNTMPKASPSRLRPRGIPSPSQEISDGKPTPTPRRSYLTAVESTKQNTPQRHIYEVPFVPKNDDSSKLQYRHLQFDSNSKMYRQSKPPTLPPKLTKSKKSSPALPLKLNKKSKRIPQNDQNEEPVYAKVDMEKKRSERASKRGKDVDSYVKAHQTIITVCKQRMKEEKGNSEYNDDPRYLHREVSSDVKHRRSSGHKRERKKGRELIVWV
ncbi:uncharacterized protein LOC143460856 isoform X2 [Clavelina lepadiformis]|uniref:uncharacterized protein LOC143460856 isoform X2 n=1 Tax=Clavelina lepadiformis TaxID=159417 RepID=UPI0040435587